MPIVRVLHGRNTDDIEKKVNAEIKEMAKTDYYLDEVGQLTFNPTTGQYVLTLTFREPMMKLL